MGHETSARRRRWDGKGKQVASLFTSMFSWLDAVSKLTRGGGQRWGRGVQAFAFFLLLVADGSDGWFCCNILGLARR